MNDEFFICFGDGYASLVQPHSINGAFCARKARACALIGLDKLFQRLQQLRIERVQAAEFGGGIGVVNVFHVVEKPVSKAQRLGLLCAHINPAVGSSLFRLVKIS